MEDKLYHFPENLILVDVVYYKVVLNFFYVNIMVIANDTVNSFKATLKLKNRAKIL